MLAGRCVSGLSHNAKSSMKSSSATNISLLTGAINGFLAPASVPTPSIQTEAAELQLQVKGHITMTPSTVKSIIKPQQQSQQQVFVLRQVAAPSSALQYGVAQQQPSAAAVQMVSPKLPTAIQMITPQPSAQVHMVNAPPAAPQVHMVNAQPGAGIQLMAASPQTVIQAQPKAHVARSVLVPVATTEVLAAPKSTTSQAHIAIVPQQVADTKGVAVNLNNFLTLTGEFELPNLLQASRQLFGRNGGMKEIKLIGTSDATDRVSPHYMAAETLEILKPQIEAGGDWASRLLAKFDGLTTTTLLGKEDDAFAQFINKLKKGEFDMKSAQVPDEMVDRLMHLRRVVQNLGPENNQPAQAPAATVQQPVQIPVRTRATLGSAYFTADESSYASESGSESVSASQSSWN